MISSLEVGTMIGENRQSVTDEPVEVQDCRKITDHFRGIYSVYPNLIKKNRRMPTCNRLDLQTLGSQPIMSNNLPDHCFRSVMADDVWSMVARVVRLDV